MKKLRLFSKRKALIFTAVAVFIFAGVYSLLITVNNWFNANRFLFQAPIEITLHKPLQIVKRELLRPQIIEVVNELPELKDLTPVEVKICNKWGSYECKIAVSVARAESGMRHDAIGVNTNGSVDIGLFQINSIHYKKDECSLDKIVTVDGNIDCAYSIWEASGWSPWVVFQTGAFKGEL